MSRPRFDADEARRNLIAHHARRDLRQATLGQVAALLPQYLRIVKPVKGMSLALSVTTDKPTTFGAFGADLRTNEFVVGFANGTVDRIDSRKPERMMVFVWDEGFLAPVADFAVDDVAGVAEFIVDKA